MQTAYRLVVFDWDGTLMNSVERIVASIRAAIDLVGAEPREPERIRGIIGLGLAEAVRRLYPGADADFIGYLLAVATGKGVRGLRKDLQDTATATLFHATRTAEETRSKPDPLMLVELVEELGVDMQQVLMVGDTEFDMQMAASAGAHAVGLTCGVHPAERLLRHRPRAVLPGVADLPDFLLSDA